MAENKFMQFIPPQLRGPATDVGIFGRVATDNVLGFIDNYLFDGKARRFDDDFESTGETLGTALREEPIETGKALGTGIYEGAKSIYDDPGAAVDSFTTGLGETFDRLNTPYDQLDLSTEEAQRERAGDIAIFGEALGAGGVLTKGLTSLAKKQLKQKVIEENPGLNEDQVNSIVEDTDYDPTEGFGYATPGFGDPVPIETAGDAMENFFLDDRDVDVDPDYVADMGYDPAAIEDVDGNLYGPPDTFDENNPPEIEDLMEPNLIVDMGQPYRIGDTVLDADMGEGVVDDGGMINYNGIRISSDRPVIGVDIDEVGRDITFAGPMTTFEELVERGFADPDDELARIETLLPEAQVAERVAARREAVAEFFSQRGLSPISAREALVENNRPILMQELREFVSQRTQQTLPSESDIFYRIDSLNGVPDFPDEITPLPREAIEVDEDEIRDAILLDDDADIPVDGNELVNDFLPNYARYTQLPPDSNTNVQGFDTTWLTAPGYGRFTNDANTPVETIPSEPAELAAGDIKLTGENSYLTSRMDTALSELSQNQTKFASMEQLVNTLTKKYGVQPAELQARGIPTSQVEADLLFTNNFTPKADFDFSKDKVDLNNPFYQNILNKDPFVVRTLGGGDAAYPGEFTKGVTNYKVTIIGLENRRDLLDQGVKDADHLMGHQMQIDGPTVVHIRTGEFPVSAGGYDRKKTFHLGEIQSQVEKNSRPSRRANDLVSAVEKKMKLPDNLEYRIPEGFSMDQVANDLKYTSGKILEIRRLKEAMDAYDGGDTDALEKYFATERNGGPGMISNTAKTASEIMGKTETQYYRSSADQRFETLQAETDKVLDKYNIYEKGSGKVYTGGALVLDDFEKNLIQMYNKMPDKNKFLPAAAIENANTGVGNFFQDVMKFGGENFNASDYGVGSVFTTNRITRMGIKEALQQAVDTDADFFTLGTGQMAKDMTYGRLSGQQEYYDEIVPKTFKNIMEEISKKHGIKPPKLINRKMETLDEYGKNVVTRLVPGIELTDELREIFKSGKVEAFKEGGLATLSSSLRPKLRPGTLESLKEQIERDDRQTKGFGDLEYRAELEPQFSYNPIARLGYDPDRHRVVNVPTGPAGYREGFSTALYANRLRGGEKTIANLMSLGLSRENAERIKTDNIITSSNLSVPPVIAHEFTHRGFNLLREERDKDPEAFNEKYGKEAGEILNYSKHKYPGGIGQSLEEYYVEMFDDLDTRFNTSSQRVDEDYEDFPKNTIRGTVQSSFAGPTKPLRDYSPEADDKRFEQIRAFQDKVLNLRGIDKGILRLMDAAQDILTERGEPPKTKPKTKPRIKEENLNFFQKIGKAVGLKDGGLATLAKEVL